MEVVGALTGTWLLEGLPDHFAACLALRLSPASAGSSGRPSSITCSGTRVYTDRPGLDTREGSPLPLPLGFRGLRDRDRDRSLGASWRPVACFLAAGL